MPGATTLNRFFYVYILKGIGSKNTQRYVGFTSDLRKRIDEHNQGKSFATAPRRPFALVYYEACRSKSDAIRRERYLKGTRGRRWLTLRIHDDVLP